jgi:hypothetical protein
MNSEQLSGGDAELYEILAAVEGWNTTLPDTVQTAQETAKNKESVRGEWTGNIARVEFGKTHDGKALARFLLAEHPEPDATSYISCYNTGVFAERLRVKALRTGMRVHVRGTLQERKRWTQRDGTVVERPVVFVYGVRLLDGGKAAKR